MDNEQALLVVKHVYCHHRQAPLITAIPVIDDEVFAAFQDEHMKASRLVMRTSCTSCQTIVCSPSSSQICSPFNAVRGLKSATMSELHKLRYRRDVSVARGETSEMSVPTQCNSRS